MPKQKLVYIKWCDAMTNLIPWLSEEEALEWADTENWVNEQVGWIIKETKKYILLAGERNLSMDVPQYGHLMKIPTTWIMERHKLTQKRNDK